MLIFFYVVVYSCVTSIFGAYIYRLLVSCVADVIRAEYRTILNLLYSHMEFNFVGFLLIAFIKDTRSSVGICRTFILLIRILISVCNYSA